MAYIYVTEYAQLARSLDGPHVMAGQEPAVANQQVGNAGASTQSAAFNVATRFVMVHTDSICSVLFGTNPTAVVGKHRMAAGETRFYGVVGGHKVAAVLNT